MCVCVCVCVCVKSASLHHLIFVANTSSHLSVVPAIFTVQHCSIDNIHARTMIVWKTTAKLFRAVMYRRAADSGAWVHTPSVPIRGENVASSPINGYCIIFFCQNLVCIFRP